ncbi:hypothetical protein Tco_0067484 [Tanacetum coccineum]
MSKLLKENETLKKHYKDLYDSIKVTRTKTIEQTTSLIAKNDEFKAQLQEKGFSIAPLKNKLRKLSGNSKCVFNANHDACVTKFLNEVNSRAKVPSHKTTNRNKPVKQISVTKKPERQIPTGHRFSIKKTSVVHEKTKTPRSCLRWKPTGRILKTIGLRWVLTGKIFTSSTTMVDSEPLHGSNTGTPFNRKKERIKVWIKENVIFGRPRLHGTTLIQEIFARLKF